MDAENAETMVDEPPKCKLVINVAAPMIFMLAVSVYAAVKSANGTEFATGDVIAISITLSVGVLWIIGSILRYRKEVINTVTICIKSQKKAVKEDNEARIQFVEIQTENGLLPKTEKSQEEKIDAENETVPLCNNRSPVTTQTTSPV